MSQDANGIIKKHQEISTIVITLIKNHYSKETWDLYSLERQVTEIIKFLSDLDEIKSTSLEKKP